MGSMHLRVLTASAAVVLAAPFLSVVHAAPAMAAPSATCDNVKATIVGTPGDDVICGGDGNNTLNGGDGDDIFVHEGGNDAMDGGTGFNLVSYFFAFHGV